MKHNLPQQSLLCLLLGFGFVSASQSDIPGPIPTNILIGVLVFYGVLLLITIILLVFSLKKKGNKNDSETHPLMAWDHANVTVSAEHQSYLLSEVKSDEVLAWAFEPVLQNHKAIDSLGPACVMLIVSVGFFLLQKDRINIWILVIAGAAFATWMYLFIEGCRFIKIDTRLYGVTNKRVFMIVLSPRLRKPHEVISMSSDYEGLQQISMMRKEDGSGTLTFSLSLTGAHPNPYANPYAFENISNVTQVKDLIEGYKSAHQTV